MQIEDINSSQHLTYHFLREKILDTNEFKKISNNNKDST